ncbi:DMT family transporter [Roseospira goensis]|uniref:O-acetylserine/cysteine efflux transporter n=1 Tax=Roseospira goensis TaxID=391922 RepID=A0A7W6RZS5_9PROT|nr:EamA family transporter [Roseospira goensis]MBB4286233.1 O-acetylserine/cysteine efflux transporter [Roseospira goensis]
MPVPDILLALLVQSLWGLNFVAAKVGVDHLPPLMFTAIRFAIAAALIVPFVPRPKGRALRGVLALSVTFGTLHFGVLFAALPHLDAATAAVVIQTGPPFSTLLGVLIFKETIGWRRVLGLVLAFSGVVVVAGEPQVTAVLPVLMLLLAAFAWAVSNVIVKTTRDLPALAVTGWLCLLAIPQVAALSWLLEDGHLAAARAAPWYAWAGLVYTAVAASLIAHSLWYALLRRHPLGVISPWGLLAPVIGIAAGIVLLGEAATWQKFVGGALTITGVAIIQIRSARRGRPVVAAPEPPDAARPGPRRDRPGTGEA